MNELVKRLTRPQPVETARPAKTARAIKKSIDKDYIHVTFTATGTELGVQIDRRDSIFEGGNFKGACGRIHLVGGLILNYDKVRCVADIDLATCEGVGYLEPVSDEEYDAIMGRD